MNDTLITYYIICNVLPVHRVDEQHKFKEFYIEVLKEENNSIKLNPALRTKITANILDATLFRTKETAVMVAEQIVRLKRSLNPFYMIKEILCNETTAKDKVWWT